MRKYNIIEYKSPTINKVLSELNMDIFKSKNQFFMDAATYYIEHYGREALTAMQANNGRMPIIQQQADTDDNLNSDDESFDDVIVQRALDWMGKD